VIMKFIEELRAEGYRVEPICAALTSSGCRVAPRTYRSWRSVQPSHRMLHDAVVVDRLRSTIGTPEGLYGRRKMTTWLRRQGLQVSHCQVDRLMRQEGLHGVRRGKQVKTTIPAKDHDRADDQLNRAFDAAAPNRVWVADFERHEAFANPGGGGRPPLDACRSRCVEAGGRSIASAWGWLVEQSSTTTSRPSTAGWGGLG
jgi:putative transposase